jgi:hypothetical protein
MKPTTKRRCTKLTKDGKYCRAWALRGSDPPTCAIHAGRVTGQGAPQGNRNAVKHGIYAEFDLDGTELPPINGIIQDLVARQVQLSAVIDTHIHDLSIQDLARLFAIHGQNASRLGRLLRDRKALTGETADRFQQIVDMGVDEAVWYPVYLPIKLREY